MIIIIIITKCNSQAQATQLTFFHMSLCWLFWQVSERECEGVKICLKKKKELSLWELV